MLNVFVYGTLRENEANDIGRAAQRSGTAQPRWLGRGSVKGTLYDLGAYPGLVPDTAAGEVYGDVFEIDEALLPVLDKIEEVFPHHPREFQRSLIQVQLNGRLLPCQFYPVDAASTVGRTPIECGDWVVHRRMRDHGAQPGEADVALSKVAENAA
ncbi:MULTISPECIES: gamma-glutamylcyclotransferase family protein [Burkholderiaceae]|uniref:gamma-glutamylcyclotransferase family protein n=1 Tax=Burkholderiaceae TaxID=119060 RepID=UPI00096843BE|nr:MULTISPECIES: gamma-glutamylcyclotransferase family protein [Burkholderiaceae]MCF2133815.1 gamma-glutamylcyclotransferase [Mycetohabitans sp. B3]MCG1040795.1 gamma-glutamylcyclotransferase [Mycetohabitans sp. B7]SIT65294.1 Uncharacterized conserved protein YtfP, gamma-glutamylcyclotransferase (GGCT)/AIG2-like family [Burkholderia sp. b14]